MDAVRSWAGSVPQPAGGSDSGGRAWATGMPRARRRRAMPRSRRARSRRPTRRVAASSSSAAGVRATRRTRRPRIRRATRTAAWRSDRSYQAEALEDAFERWQAEGEVSDPEFGPAEKSIPPVVGKTSGMTAIQQMQSLLRTVLTRPVCATKGRSGSARSGLRLRLRRASWLESTRRSAPARTETRPGCTRSHTRSSRSIRRRRAHLSGQRGHVRYVPELLRLRGPPDEADSRGRGSDVRSALPTDGTVKSV
jgi:hypothetical protein